MQHYYNVGFSTGLVTATTLNVRSGPGTKYNVVATVKKNEYITIDENGYIYLTEKGQSIAERIYERHNILTEFFISLGVNEEIASQDACRIEHVISDETFEKIKLFKK